MRLTKAKKKKILIGISILAFILLVIFDYIIFAIGAIEQQRIKFFAFQIVQSDDSTESILFMILVSMIFGLYLNTIGFSIGITKLRDKIIILVLAVFFVIVGITNISIRVSLNIWVLNYISYQPNSVDGILFFINNAPFFLSVYLFSFFWESDLYAQNT